MPYQRKENCSMRRITINSSITYFLICRGDMLGVCTTCKFRFSCYTGEFPSYLLRKGAGWRDVILHIEDEYRNIIDYDYDTHDKYYNLRCARNELRFNHCSGSDNG